MADAHHKSPLNLSCSMVLIGNKRQLKLDELTYAWVSKLGDKNSLSITDLKVHGFGSLYQTQFRITKTLIICHRMEELITLNLSNFAILGRLGKECAQRIGCSNQVADCTPQYQLFLDEIWKECPSWNTAPKQEWGLFLLE